MAGLDLVSTRRFSQDRNLSNSGANENREKNHPFSVRTSKAIILILLPLNLSCSQNKPQKVAAIEHSKKVPIIVGAYSQDEFFSRFVTDNGEIGDPRPAKIVVVKMPTSSLEPFGDSEVRVHGDSTVYKARFEDAFGREIASRIYLDPRTSYCFVGLLPGYGYAFKDVRFTISREGDVLGTIDLGNLDAEKLLLSDVTGNDPQFRCVLSGNHLMVVARGELPKDEFYSFRAVRTTFHNLQDRVESAYVYGHVTTGIGGWDTSRPLRIPNAACQRAIELEIKRFRRIVQSGTVTLSGARIEEKFGVPVLRVDRECRGTTKFGATVVLSPQYFAPRNAPKRPYRELRVENLSLLPAKGLDDGNPPFAYVPALEIEAVYVGPKPEDLNLDSVRLSHVVSNSSAPTSGPFKLGPVDLVLRLNQRHWQRVDMRTVRIPIEGSEKQTRS